MLNTSLAAQVAERHPDEEGVAPLHVPGGLIVPPPRNANLEAIVVIQDADPVADRVEALRLAQRVLGAVGEVDHRRSEDRPVTGKGDAPADPHFLAPSKPVGRYLPAEEAARFVALGQLWEDRGPRGWRRVVASPEPRSVVDAPAIAALVAAGFVVVCAGGGGVPVVQGGPLHGVEAVIDKDLTAALLARELGADTLVVATDVPHVVLGFGTDAARPLGRVTPAELRAHAAAGEFARGSMAPKVEAVLRFVTGPGRPRRAVVTSLEHIADAVTGDAVGTVVTAHYE